MRSDRILIGAVLLLGIGLSLILGYCNGTTSFNFSYPLSGTSVHIDITTNGIPAAIGLPLTVIGLVLLLAVLILGVVAQFQPVKRNLPVDLPGDRLDSR
jgi:hypothetical protein